MRVETAARDPQTDGALCYLVSMIKWDEGDREAAHHWLCEALQRPSLLDIRPSVLSGLMQDQALNCVSAKTEVERHAACAEWESLAKKLLEVPSSVPDWIWAEALLELGAVSAAPELGLALAQRVSREYPDDLRWRDKLMDAQPTLGNFGSAPQTLQQVTEKEQNQVAVDGTTPCTTGWLPGNFSARFIVFVRILSGVLLTSASFSPLECGD